MTVRSSLKWCGGFRPSVSLRSRYRSDGQTHARNDGDELAMQIRENYPELPIVMLTSIGTQMFTEGCTPECVDYVLAKPTTNERIEMAFENALSGHSGGGQRPGT